MDSSKHTLVNKTRRKISDLENQGIIDTLKKDRKQ